MPVDCTPATLLTTLPCLNALSQSQLKMLQLLMWADLSNVTLPDDVSDLLTDSSGHLPLSQTQRLQIEIVSMAEAAGNSDTVLEMIEKAKCLPCIAPQQVDAAISYLKCLYFKNQS